jgi:predicted AlkP superfamily pyrophosphatase or phosphodiesterase
MNHGYILQYAHTLYQLTAPGHASIYTGTTPSTHGIENGNDWFNKATERYVFKWMMQFKTVGEGTEKEGAAMSLKLLSTTIT